MNQHETTVFKIDTTDDCRLENIWLEISKGLQKYVIGRLYRHPELDIDKFSAKIKKILLQVKKSNLPCFIAGDVNIDLVKYNSHNAISNYLDNLLMYRPNYVSTIVMPTRITDKSATIIDHICYSPGPKYNFSFSVHSGNIWCDITDHLPNYCLLVGMKYMTVLRLILHLRNFNRKLNVVIKIASDKSDCRVNELIKTKNG